ncbi:DUF4044 domain-containing protein [Jeotgalibaca dankookensis]|nr:DUF4044 domain-containing protein [Jeotgalibaca dankookensis]
MGIRLDKKSSSSSSKFNKISKFIIWLMVFAMVGGIVISLFASLLTNL